MAQVIDVEDLSEELAVVAQAGPEGQVELLDHGLYLAELRVSTGILMRLVDHFIRVI